VGIAMCSESGKCFYRLYKRADMALYRVKKARKNGYAFYDPLIDEPMAVHEL
jgi:GGDEF domain-containing protein